MKKDDSSRVLLGVCGRLKDMTLGTDWGGDVGPELGVCWAFCGGMRGMVLEEFGGRGIERVLGFFWAGVRDKKEVVIEEYWGMGVEVILGTIWAVVVEGIGEGQSTTRPPLFDGTNYTYWKERMRIYIRSTNFQLWLVIKNGEEVPMKKVGDKLIPKIEDEFDAEDIKKVENYAKAINMLYCAVNPDDYRKISCCSTAKEMWDKLEVTYEGTDQGREAKIDFLTQEYEMFRMKEHEKIDDMFDRFSKIVNNLHALKKTYTDRDLVRKILRSLTSEWRSKADAIYESIGMSNVTIDGLRGNLKTYESTILNPSLNDQGKGIALKASKEPAMNDSSDEDEVKLVMKKFCKLLWKKEKVEDGPVCYGCGKAGHIKNKCPRSERNAPHFKKQRAYISWGGASGDESSEQEGEEEANLCLIAQEEEESANNENQEVRISSTGSYSLEEMQEAIQELYDEFVSASKTNKALKKRFSSLETEFEKLQKENKKLKEENKIYGKRSADKPESSTKPCDSCIALKEQVAELENTVKKFNKPHKDLNLIFDSMQYTKQGIGFGKIDEPSNKENVEQTPRQPSKAQRTYQSEELRGNQRWVVYPIAGKEVFSNQ
ncbi:unnamed protein product [Cuscuta campestris]|uniref:CCHC-type domain-containing protein n=1 Tax=Cuscuta campestris TaxID=132261 RepID=A0A484MB60_9ASTE|nr:unnamed protein product [Cuscuta campestris]